MPVRHFVVWLSVWVLMVVFAHEFFVQRNNQVTQQQLAQMNQLSWHHQWPMQSTAEVVSAYQKDWTASSQGLVTQNLQSTLSVELMGKVIDSEIHGNLSIQVQLNRPMTAGDIIKVEFSNQQQQLYYYSAELAIDAFNQGLDLNRLNWQLKRPQQNQDQQLLQWSDLGGLDGLVLRFYLAEPAKLVVQQVRVEQTAHKQWQFPNPVTCYDLVATDWRCHFNNHISELDKKHNHAASSQLIVFESWLTFSPWYVFAVAWMMASWAMSLAGAQQSIKSVMFVVALVFVVVFMTHQNIVVTYATWIKWCLLGLLLPVLYFYKSVFWQIKATAWAFTLCSLLAAVFILMWRPLNFDFIGSLPAYFVWALVQQMLLGPVFSDGLMKSMQVDKKNVAMVVGVLFSFIHAPNTMLMLVTLLGGYVWSYSWLRWRNIYANAFSHALLALVFYQVMPSSWLGSARIGVFF